ncbi:hypothetical protein Ancab_012829 [Ancistrocladus abbreviatus]
MKGGPKSYADVVQNSRAGLQGEAQSANKVVSGSAVNGLCLSDGQNPNAPPFQPVFPSLDRDSVIGPQLMQRGHSNLGSKCAGSDSPAPIFSQHSPTGQTWNFLTQLGVGGGVDSESMEQRLEEMETRDASLYAKALKEQNVALAEEENVLL